MTRLLLVEDDPSILDFLAELFTEEGYQVVTARQALDAVLALGGPAFACVLTDSRWFATPGRQFRDLRQVMAAAGPTPVVLLTAYDEAARWDATALGLAAIRLKPIDLDELLALVHRLVGPTAS